MTIIITPSIQQNKRTAILLQYYVICGPWRMELGLSYPKETSSKKSVL
jgi:hypothetical protein